MNILAFDLANFSSSLALMMQGEIVFSEYKDEFRGQDVTLLPRLKALLKDHNLKFQDLDRIVTTTGPGSFTGIRVALATAQGLSFAADVPALGVNSFDWVLKTYSTPLPQKTLVLLESLRLELYGQLFDKDGLKRGPAFSLSPQDIAANPLFEAALCLGNGVKHMAPYDFQINPFMPQAVHLAEFAAKISDDDLQQYPCVPIYVRDADTSKPKNV